MGASYDVKIAALVQSPLRRVARVEHSVTEDNLIVEGRVGTRWLIPEKRPHMGHNTWRSASGWDVKKYSSSLHSQSARSHLLDQSSIQQEFETNQSVGPATSSSNRWDFGPRSTSRRKSRKKRMVKKQVDEVSKRLARVII